MKDTRNRVFQVFNLIRHLNTPPGKTVKQLEKVLNASKSAIYRDIQLLEELGYIVDTDENNRKFLQLDFSKSKDNILEADELFFLRDILQQYSTDPDQAHLVQNILHKFDINLSVVPIANLLPHFHKNKILKLIRTGIELNLRLRIRGYRSMTSASISDRHVEPLEITQDSRYLIAWDLDKDDQRQFKIDRIEDIDLLEEKIATLRDYSPMDIFGLTGPQWLSVKLKLSNTAHHLLLEEFPLSKPFVYNKDGQAVFEGIVRNWKGIGRFVLGLPGEVQVVSPHTFKTYLKEKISLY